MENYVETLINVSLSPHSHRHLAYLNSLSLSISIGWTFPMRSCLATRLSLFSDLFNFTIALTTSHVAPIRLACLSTPSWSGGTKSSKVRFRLQFLVQPLLGSRDQACARGLLWMLGFGATDAGDVILRPKPPSSGCCLGFWSSRILLRDPCAQSPESSVCLMSDVTQSSDCDLSVFEWFPEWVKGL